MPGIIRLFHSYLLRFHKKVKAESTCSSAGHQVCAESSKLNVKSSSSNFTKRTFETVSLPGFLLFPLIYWTILPLKTRT